MGNMRDYSEEPGSFGKGFFFGMLSGGIMGAAIALLMAPKSGKELRSDLADMTNQYADKTGDAINNASEKARQHHFFHRQQQG